MDDRNPPNKIHQLIQWLKWKNACLDEELEEAEKEEIRLRVEQEAAYDENDQLYDRLHRFGEKIKSMNIKSCTCGDNSHCNCRKVQHQTDSRMSTGLGQQESGTSLQDSGKVETQTDSQAPARVPDPTRHISVMKTKEKPFPKMYLFKFHASLSQDASDDKQNPLLTTCAFTCKLFAIKFKQDPSNFDHSLPPNDVPDKVFDQVVASLHEGNGSHSEYNQEEMAILSTESLKELSGCLATRLVKQIDVDTRELGTVVPHVMSLKVQELILFSKGGRVVSLFSHEDWVMMFDSHRHIVNSGTTPKCFGSYLFYAKKEEALIKQLFQSYDKFCDLKPGTGQFAVFEI